MAKWIVRIFVFILVGWIGYSVYDFHRGGFFNMPDMPEGAYAFSFKGGFRGIALNADVAEPSSPDTPKFFRTLMIANSDRRYLGVPFDVPGWMNKAWSTCVSPTPDERTYYDANMPDDWKKELVYARFEAVCFVTIDSDRTARGLLYSVPRL